MSSGKKVFDSGRQNTQKNIGNVHLKQGRLNSQRKMGPSAKAFECQAEGLVFHLGTVNFNVNDLTQGFPAGSLVKNHPAMQEIWV